MAHADHLALALEARDLMRSGGQGWGDLPALPREIWAWRIRPWDWSEGQDRWLEAWYGLPQGPAAAVA